MVKFATFQRGICRSGKLIAGDWPRVQRMPSFANSGT